MGLVLAVVVAVLTIVLFALYLLSGIGSPAPSQQDYGMNPFWILAIGFVISAALALTHFHPIHFSW